MLGCVCRQGRAAVPRRPQCSKIRKGRAYTQMRRSHSEMCLVCSAGRCQCPLHLHSFLASSHDMNYHWICLGQGLLYHVDSDGKRRHWCCPRPDCMFQRGKL